MNYFWSIRRPPRNFPINFKFCMLVVNIKRGKATQFGVPTAPWKYPRRVTVGRGSLRPPPPAPSIWRLTLKWMGVFGPTYGWGGGVKWSTPFILLSRTLRSFLMLAIYSIWSNKKNEVSFVEFENRLGGLGTL